MNVQDCYDDAMFDYSTGEYVRAAEKLSGILNEDPDHFDARCALAMCYYRMEDYARAIVEGHKAEKLRPQEQMVHTNLSLFYMKSGDKKTAEHHGLQARIASWRENMAPPPQGAPADQDPELMIGGPKPPPIKLPSKLADAPWKKKPGITGGSVSGGGQSGSGAAAPAKPATPDGKPGGE